ncbi:hypothetical protein [Falsiroseomonas sp. HW251]|uniref:hypothetical protein n=1 Tax=Falsiroseomonas sp. HW251 TaxID=3390998 RepID=UPI003D3211EB
MASGLLGRSGTTWPRAAVLLLALVVLGAGAALRSAEYDESYTRLVTSPVPRPDWPDRPFTPEEARPRLDAVANASVIARNLRETDVHPPLYFWLAGAWRAAGGTSVEALRALSVLLSLGAVAAFMAAAAAAGLPPVATGLLTALSYGFAYTGGVARGFALAHLLIGLAALAVLRAWRGRSAGLAALGGLAAGAASCANYLAAFPGAAMLAWLVVAPLPWRDRLRLAAAAGVPFLLAQGVNLHFFLAQRASRPGQFEPFRPLDAIASLARFNLANLLGALPLYLMPPWSTLAAAGLAALALGAGLAVALRWRAIGPTRWFWLAGFAAPSLGLLLLAATAGAMAIELRYLAFAAPFAAALVAGAAAGWQRRAPRLAPLALGLLLAVQAAGVAGMALHPETRQGYRESLAAAAPSLPGGLLLVPIGNDGVGLVGAVLAEAPRDQPILLLREAEAATLPARVATWPRLVLLGLHDRDGARQLAAARAALLGAGWTVAATPWRDARRGFAVEVLAPRRLSGVADRAEIVLVGGAHHGGEEP